MKVKGKSKHLYHPLGIVLQGNQIAPVDKKPYTTMPAANIKRMIGFEKHDLTKHDQLVLNYWVDSWWGAGHCVEQKLSAWIMIAIIKHGA